MPPFDVIVLGQGYAGLVTARKAAAQGLRVATVEAMFPGGLITSINELHPVPEGLAPCGPEMTADLSIDVMDSGVHTVSAVIDSVEAADGLWQVNADGEVLKGRHLVIATGARLRKLGIPGEAEFEGMGVSSCADCDGPLIQGKPAVIVGGGDAAFQEAVALAAYASTVRILMRGAQPRARAEFVEAVAAHPAIEVIANVRVSEILGASPGGVTAVRVVGDDSDVLDLPTSAIFAFAGLVPAAEYLPGTFARDDRGAVVVTDDRRAGQPRAWAIGAVRTGFGGLLSDADVDAEVVVAAIRKDLAEA